MRATFGFVGGDPALDFVNTADWTGEGPVAERLPDYESLVEWAVAAGVLPAGAGERLRGAAAARRREARAAHAKALEVRALLRAALRGGPEAADALRRLDPLVSRAMGRLSLAPASRAARRVQWTWSGMDRRLDAPLWPVLRSAAELLVSDEVDRVRTCDGPDCGWMYVDRSRNGFRRWCQMRTCGTREKSRRRRERETA